MLKYIFYYICIQMQYTNYNDPFTAEQYFKKALSFNPCSPIVCQRYSKFLKDIKKDEVESDKYDKIARSSLRFELEKLY